MGPGFIVGVRISGDELIADGLSREDCHAIGCILAGSGLADYLNVMGGSARHYRVGAATLANSITVRGLSPARQRDSRGGRHSRVPLRAHH